MTPTFRIFVSSPGDVGREREVTHRVIERVEGRFGGRVKIAGYFWEHEPMRTTRGDFQTQIEEPAKFDLLICILWSRLGSRLHPGVHHRADGSEYASGTEYEFENAADAFRARGSPDLLVYRRKEMPAFPPEPPEELRRRSDQWSALKQFCDRWFRDSTEGTFKAAYNSYKDAEEFQTKLELHLGALVREWFEKRGAAVGAAAGPRSVTWTHESPYRGLQVFEFAHEPIFFGRMRARDEVLGALQARFVEERCPFVLLLGASGSGKSSLMRAGVLPWLVRPGVIEGIGLWRRLVWRPSDGTGDLIDGLARALIGPDALPELIADKTPIEEIARLLREEPKSIVGLVKGALSQAAAAEQQRENLREQPVARLALGIDQLEEIFTLHERFTVQDRLALFRAVEVLVRAGYAWTVITLRSDFYSRCEEIPDLVELKKGKGQYHLLPPSGAELGQMIRYPAEAAGVRFEEHPEKGKLDERIRDAALAQPGALPLLEYVLDELYRVGRHDDVLTHAEYDRIGGVEGALAGRAEVTFGQLSAPAQDSFPVVARALVRLNEAGHGLRQPAPAVAFATDPAAQELVQSFVAARLFVSDKSESGQSTIMVAHEALLRAWERMATWLRENREFLLARARIEQGAAIWEAKDRDTSYLLSAGKPLEEAEDIMRQHQSVFTASGQAYVQASVLAVQEATAEKDRERLRAALRQHKMAEQMWEEFKATGNQRSDEWRFTHLAEIESSLVNALALDHELAAAVSMLIGIRTLLVEAGIKTRDLNLASIYLQKLKTMTGAESRSAPELGPQLEAAWAEVDPARNKFVLRVRRWALLACWVPFIWLGGFVAILGSLSDQQGFTVYVLVAGAVSTLVHFVTAIFAVMVASGDQTAVEKTNAASIASVLMSFFALNAFSVFLAGAVLNDVGKVRMQKLFWPKRASNTKPQPSKAK